MSRSDDTIFAQASGTGRAAIAVIRLSGPASGTVLDRLTGGRRPPPRLARLRILADPLDGAVLDHALVLWFPAPASFTGEDAAELHIHGGSAVRAAVLRSLAREPGCRMAEPGEFVRRAFLAGRMDLSAVEGLADLIDAETEAQRRQAVRQMEGGLAQTVEGWRDRLLDASALVEASLDFADEDDVPTDVEIGAGAALASLAAEMRVVLDGAGRGERLREGWLVVLAGPPNAGKSTLLNALARRDVALVSPIAGTTRDAIEVRCDVQGWPVTFVDTAGVHETDDVLERQGIARTRSRAATADLALWLTPAGEGARPELLPCSVLPVVSKQDLAPGGSATGLSFSAETGYGMEALVDAIAARLGLAEAVAGDAVLTRERHRLALAEAVASLERAGAQLAAGSPDLAAEELRLGRNALGSITGRTGVEDVLDRVFGQFCIGK
jgi:tRNA modification GTPase